MHSVLLISAVPGAADCAQTIGKQLALRVEIAPDRRAGLAALRRNEFAVVILDENLALADAAATDVLWKQARLAIPIEINFAICGCARVVREVRAALARRDQEQMLAMRAAATLVESELNSAVTGLILQSELALGEAGVSASVAARLSAIRELANSLRGRLRQPDAAQETEREALVR